MFSFAFNLAKIGKKNRGQVRNIIGRVPRGKINLEKIRASLVTICPHCNARIEPNELMRVDWDHVECPKCGKKFIPGRVEAGQCV